MTSHLKAESDGTIEKRIGNRIKCMLIMRGMNQAKLAAATGMSTQTINRICNGLSDFQISTLKLIEEALDCKLILVPNEDLE